MESKVYHFPVQIYYEDTDHSGVVYHANYLKYFERAREEVIGSEKLAAMWNEEKKGFAVYKLDVQYNEGAEFGDLLDIRTSFKKDGDYRVVWRQEAWRKDGKKAAVAANIELVCVSRDKKLLKIPELDLFVRTH